MSTEPKPRAYLAVMLSLALALVAVTAFINWVVDPYDIYRVVRRPGFNAEKPQARFHDRLHKAWSIPFVKPDAVLLGTSRAQIGLSTTGPALKARGLQALNLGLPSGTPYEALRYLQSAHANKKVKLAVLGLDPLMFNATAPRKNMEFSEARLNRSFIRADLAETLLSTDALMASMRTVRKQSQGSYLDEGGTRSIDVQLRAIETLGGTRAVFLDAEKTYFSWFRCFRMPANPEDAPHFDDFAALLDFALSQNIELRLYISPAHARAHELIRISGHWGEYENWKRRLLATVNQASQRHPERPALELWDFSEARGLTTEAVPPLADKSSQMENYWDSSHFKTNVGDRVLATILGQDTSDFGQLLRADALERQLTHLRDSQRGYAESHAEDVRELEAIHQEIMTKEGRKSCDIPMVASQ